MAGTIVVITPWHTVSRRGLIVDAWFQSQASPYGICLRQSDTMTGSSSNTQVPAC